MLNDNPVAAREVKECVNLYFDSDIFSTQFQIECGDRKRGHGYILTWERNMGVKRKPKNFGKAFAKVMA